MLLKVYKQQAATEGQYWPGVKQQKWISHKQLWQGRGSQHFLHLCLYQQGWASGFGNKDQGWYKQRPIVNERRVGVRPGTGAWSYRSMGPDSFHSRVLRDLVDIFVRPLSIVLEKLWRSEGIPEDWQKANDSPVYRKAWREDPGNYRPLSLISVPRKIRK